ncbi:MAG: hypothetical protein Q8K78_06875 [Planctomycetaceae bacterium]|nr:hypothetical protein [Planctomycetaceae bacterium]
MRAVVSIILLGLFGAGLYYLSIATGGSMPEAAATNGLIAGLVSWGIGAVLTIIAMFAFRERRP